jgi:hypothetical protein
MVAVSFRDYSNVLLPLQPLGDASATPPRTQPQPPQENFRNTLARVTEPVASTTVRPLGEDTYPMQRQVSNFTTQNSASPVEPVLSADNERLLQACKDIEGFFLGMLLRNMGQKFTDQGVFGSSFESGYYQDMFFTEVAKNLADTGRTLGISEAVYRDIIMKEPEKIVA